MDYAWGANGLDAIITQVFVTPFFCYWVNNGFDLDSVHNANYSYDLFFFSQLLNQFENTGPPPADRDKIKSLPTVVVTDEHVGKWALEKLF